MAEFATVRINFQISVVNCHEAALALSSQRQPKMIALDLVVQDMVSLPLRPFTKLLSFHLELKARGPKNA